jgi:phosphatidylinositol dimannoside acyltransferase
VSTSPREWLVDRGYGAGWQLVRALPAGVAERVFRAGADRAIRRGGAGVAQLRKNLARVVPDATPDELDELVREGMRSYARYWRETFQLPAMDLDALRSRLDGQITGVEHLEAGLAAGRGVILALPHSGNWEIPGIWLVGHSGRFTTVAERLRPESLFERFVAYREALGFEILPLTGGALSPASVLASRLRENRVVCLVADRDLSTSGVPVKFFGELAQLPAGPAHLAATTGAALIPAGNWYTPDGWGFRAHPPIYVGDRRQITAAAQSLADAFAEDIAAHPTDWHMMQTLWFDDLSERQQEVLARASRRANRDQGGGAR